MPLSYKLVLCFLVFSFLVIVTFHFPTEEYAHFIAGQLFYDANSNGIFDNKENPYANGNIEIIGPVTQQKSPYKSNGSYIFDSIPSGTYTVTWLDPPSGFVAPSYTVHIGSGCSVGASKDANCTASDDVNDLNIGYFMPSPTSTLTPTLSPTPTSTPTPTLPAPTAGSTLTSSPSNTPPPTGMPGLSCPSGWYYVRHNL